MWKKQRRALSKILSESRKHFQKQRLKFIGLSRPLAASVSGICASATSLNSLYNIGLKKGESREHNVVKGSQLFQKCKLH